jgi:hypothetical protein
MATQPEALRLFDPEGLDNKPSQPGTEHSVADHDAPMLSRVRTRRAPRSETTSPPPYSEPPTRKLADHGDRAECLREASEEATLVRTATEALAAAVCAARAAGCSWREIGIATGIPHQTLHRQRQR